MSHVCKKAVWPLLIAAVIPLASLRVTTASAVEPPQTLKVTSRAFQPDGAIPKKYTCDGPDISPPLAWSAAPAGTKSFALTMDDPDAPMGTWVHWVLYDLPAGSRELPENLPKQHEVMGGAHQGRNDFHAIGYGGPCPPPGPAHRYVLTLRALDSQLGLGAGATKAEVEKAMRGHILGEGQLIGRYGRGP